MIDKVNEHYIQLAKDTLEIENQGVHQLLDKFSDAPFQQSFAKAINLLLECNGRIVVSGIGKSGHIANKIAATFASTGSPAFFVHPAEASHGDLGMVLQADVFLALSYSGETAELLTIVPLIKRMGAKLIAMTGNSHSKLAELADVHLDVSVTKEACPLNLAPTTSTTVSLVMGDALAVVLLDAKNLRGHIGKQAQLINTLSFLHVNKNESLRERIGHSYLEILAGILLGVLIAFFVYKTSF
jgi:arabinose-5-phosphate isomerase